MFEIPAISSQNTLVKCRCERQYALTSFVSQTKAPPDLPPSLNEAVRLLGKLGGHLGRTPDGLYH